MQGQNDHVLKYFAYHKIGFFPFAGRGKFILKFTEKGLLFSEKRLFEVTVYFHAKVFIVKLFKADIKKI